ncbi:uncharacterized protein [Macaca nemestrina]|uniref:uncharacterized protein n=1 Tax=Macaca nemestrina TaxID=9545 RepID=UPI0039B88D5B
MTQPPSISCIYTRYQLRDEQSKAVAWCGSDVSGKAGKASARLWRSKSYRAVALVQGGAASQTITSRAPEGQQQWFPLQARCGQVAGKVVPSHSHKEMSPHFSKPGVDKLQPASQIWPAPVEAARAATHVPRDPRAARGWPAGVAGESRGRRPPSRSAYLVGTVVLLCPQVVSFGRGVPSRQGASAGQHEAASERRLAGCQTVGGWAGAGYVVPVVRSRELPSTRPAEERANMKSSAAIQAAIDLTAGAAGTVMRYLTMFLSVMDDVCGHGPMRLYHRIFTTSFLCLDMFRYINTYHGVTVASSIQYSTMLHRSVASEQWAIPCSPGGE